MNCPPNAYPESTACFQQGVARTQNAEWQLAGAVLHGVSEILLQLAWALIYGTAFWVLFGTVLYANLGQHIDWHRWTVLTDLNGRLD